jgi:hypothetical protein
VKRGVENAVKLPYSLTKTMKLFGNKSDMAKQKIKQDKLKVRKNEEDLIALFSFINDVK